MSVSPKSIIGSALQSQAAATHELSLVGPEGGSGWIVGPVGTQAQGMRGADPGYGSLASTGWGRRTDADVISWGTWRVLVPWFVSFRGATNAYAPADTATNTCIEVLSMSAQVRRASDKTWVFTHAPANYEWVAPYNLQTTGGTAGTMVYPAANKFHADVNASAHGGRGRQPLPLLNDEPDIDAIYVKLVARLSLINTGGVNDMAQSNLVLVAGADFYPNMVLTAPQVMGASSWVPGCAYGRFGWVRPNPRAFTMLCRKPGVTDQSLLDFPPHET